MPRLLILSLLPLVMFSCQSGTPSTEEAGVTSHDSPEAAFAAMQQAVENKDWKTVATLLSPESQSMLAGMSIMGSSFATIGPDGMEDPQKSKELKELLLKHGIDLEAEDPEPAEAELAGGPEAMMMSMTKPIPDKPAFIAEINAWIDKNSDSAGGAFAELGELSELSIDGDTATAMSETEFGKQPIEFRKSGEGWVIHLPVGGPSEPPMSDFDAPDDGTPGLGTFHLGERAVKFRHAIAYKSKFFDDPCTVVMLTVQPIPDRMLESLTGMLAEIQESGNDEMIFPRGTHLKLCFNDEGELVSLFGWAEGLSINGANGVESDVTIEGDRIQGKVAMPEPEEIFDETYQFDVEFDVTLLSVPTE